MGIDLRRDNRRMPQQLLNVTDIHVLLQKQGRERMPEHMRGNMQRSTNLFRVFPQSEAHGLLRQAGFPLSQEKRLLLIWMIFLRIFTQNRSYGVIGKL